MIKNRNFLVVLIILIFVLFLKYSKSRNEDNKAKLITSIGGVSLSVKDMGSNRAAFSEALYVNQGLAVRRNGAMGLMILKAADISQIKYKVACANGTSSEGTTSNETLNVCGIPLRWSTKDDSSIWVYEDPIRRLGGAAPYEVSYPVSSTNFSELMNTASNLTWLVSP